MYVEENADREPLLHIKEDGENKKDDCESQTLKGGTYAPKLPLLEKLEKHEKEKKEEAEKEYSHKCEGKAHYSKKEAITKKNYLNKNGRRVREYKCHLCDWWHLTHQPIFSTKKDNRWT